jgi:hypothetical protein
MFASYLHILKSILVVVLIYPLILGGQTNSQKKENYYTWVEVLKGKHLKKGYLTDLDNNSLYYISVRDFKEWRKGIIHNEIEIPVNNIDYLKFRKKNKILKSTILGAVIGGFGTGISFVIINELDKPCSGWLCFSNSEVYTLGFVLGVIPGAIVGAIIGQSKTKIYIGGNQTNYTRQKEKLKKFIYGEF